MAEELLWKRAVWRGIESARREPRYGNFDQVQELDRDYLFRRAAQLGVREELDYLWSQRERPGLI